MAVLKADQARVTDGTRNRFVSWQAIIPRFRGIAHLPHVLLMPFYWLLVSCAAWRAMYQLAYAPHFWEKTEHVARRKRVVTNRRSQT